jgi:pimeloyl-ACP methyl ester carboxylesterase
MGLLALLAAGLVLTLAAALAAVVRDARHPARASVGWALARGLATQPTDAGMDFTEGSVACADGTQLPIWMIPGSRPDGPALLLLHGWRRSRIDSLRRLPWILPHVRCACLMDFRGHGDAPRAASTLGSADVADACAAVRAHPDLPWIIAGHSMGAAVAIRAAAELQQSGSHIMGALLMCPYPDLTVPLAGRLASIGMPPFPLAPLAASAIGLLCGRETPIARAIGVIGASALPTVWVTCSADPIVSPEAVRALHAQAKAMGSPATLLVDTDADHDSVGTDHPRWAADAIAAITRQQAAATTP